MTLHYLVKSIVGSQAHDLASPESDIDYRGVFVQPTLERCNPFIKSIETEWIEGKDDNTSFEVGKFLFEATKSNPTTLEVFKGISSEILDDSAKNDAWGQDLLSLFPYVWSSKGVYEASRGYGHNQRTKMLDNKDGRYHKYAVAWLRTIYNAHELLMTGDFKMSVLNTPIKDTAIRWKACLSVVNPDRMLNPGEVIDICSHWEEKLDLAFARNPDKTTDVAAVSDFITALRKDYV